MKAKLATTWTGANAAVRREPSGAELATGVPCGPADEKLFNEIFFRLSGMEAELINLIEGNGLVAAEGDLFQVLRAVRSHKANYFTAGGTANALTIDAGTNFATLASMEGTEFNIKAPNGPNTGAMTLAVDAIAAAAISHLDGTAMQAGDWPDDGIGRVIGTGTGFLLRSIFRSSKAEAEAGLLTHKFISPESLFARRTPFFTLGEVSTMSIPDNVDTKVNHLTTNLGSFFADGASSAGSSQFTCGPKDVGLWLFFGYGAMVFATAPGTTNVYRLAIARNGTNGPFSTAVPPNVINTFGHIIITPYIVNNGDVFTLQAFHNTGGGTRNIGSSQFTGLRLSGAT